MVLCDRVCPRDVPPVLVPCGLVGVIPALDGFGGLPAVQSVKVGDEVSGVLVEALLVCEFLTLEDGCVPAVYQRAYTGGRVAIAIGAELAEVEAVFAVAVFVEDGTGEEEVAADEAGQLLTIVLHLLTGEGAGHAEVRTRAGAADEVLDRGVGGFDPAVTILGVFARVVDVPRSLVSVLAQQKQGLNTGEIEQGSTF